MYEFNVCCKRNLCLHHFPINSVKSHQKILKSPFNEDNIGETLLPHLGKGRLDEKQFARLEMKYTFEIYL